MLERSEVVALPLHAVLTRAGDVAEFAYFSLDGMVSNVLSMACAPDMEVLLVGMEGMVNTSMVLGLLTAPFASLVQTVGHALNSLQCIAAAVAVAACKRYFIEKCAVALHRGGKLPEGTTHTVHEYRTVLECLTRPLLMVCNKSYSS